MSVSPRHDGYVKLKEWCERGNVGIICPPKSATSKDTNRFWEELHYYRAGDLDDLIEALTAGTPFSATKHVALERLRPILEKLLGQKFSDPKFVIRGRQRVSLKAARKGKPSTLEPDEHDDQPEIKEDNDMSAIEIKPAKKSAVKKSTPTKPAAKKSAAEPGAKAMPAKKTTSGIGTFAKECIKKGMETDKILTEVKKKFPGAQTTPNNISFYRYQLKNA